MLEVKRVVVCRLSEPCFSVQPAEDLIGKSGRAKIEWVEHRGTA
jgi:hypothetical protein